MKLRHLLTGAILTVSLPTVTVTTVFTAAPKGRLKIANSTTISGWAYSSSTPDDAPNVWISIKDKNTGEEAFSQRVTAGECSDELCGSGKGNGCHAFTPNMDWSVLPYGVYPVEGYVGDSSLSNLRTYTDGNLDARQEAPTVEAQNLVPLGVFKTTGYCSYGTCPEGQGRRASTDTVATAGHTIAVDLRVIPYGSKVMMNGMVYAAEDRDEVIRGNHVDISSNTHVETRQHGAQNAEVYLIQS